MQRNIKSTFDRFFKNNYTDAYELVKSSRNQFHNDRYDIIVLDSVIVHKSGFVKKPKYPFNKTIYNVKTNKQIIETTVLYHYNESQNEVEVIRDVDQYLYFDKNGKPRIDFNKVSTNVHESCEVLETMNEDFLCDFTEF